MSCLDMHRRFPQAEILEVACALANPNDLFGQVVREGTYLRVRATVMETQMWITRRPGWAAEYMTVYGSVTLDYDLEDNPINTSIWRQPSAGRTVQRRRREIAITVDNKKQHASRGSISGSDSGSDIESEPERWHRQSDWEESNLGQQFTVWLLHMRDADRGVEEWHESLVLVRPTGDEEVCERIRLLSTQDNGTWREQFAKQTKSIVTIV